ncbi:MAG: CHAT domain-containing protein [Acidobacteria bacterium]|nr:CHAT domain-containing protein [Acidobacteriota bacterium]
MIKSFIISLVFIFSFPYIITKANTIFLQSKTSKTSTITTTEKNNKLIEKAKLEFQEKDYKQASKSISQALIYSKKGTSLYADGLVVKASIDQAQKQTIKATNSLELALSIYQKLENKEKQLNVLSELVKLYREANNSPKAITTYNKIIKIQELNNDSEGVLATNFRLASLYSDIGDYLNAINQYEKIIGHTNKNTVIGRAKRLLGIVYNRMGNYDQALLTYKECLMIYQEAKDPFNIGLVQNNIGNVFTNLGDYKQSQNYYEQALDNFEVAKQKSWVGGALQNLGSIAYYQGDYKEAISYSQRALNIFTESKDREKLLITYNNLSLYFSAQADYKTAFDYYKKAIELAEELGDKRAVATAKARLGEVYLVQQEFPLALEHFKRALELSRAISNRAEIRILSTEISQCFIEMKDYYSAIEWANQALLEARKTQEPLDITFALMTKAKALRETGKNQNALLLTDEALSLAKSFNFPAVEWQIFYLKGLLLRDESKFDEAISYLQQAVNTLQNIRNRLSGGEEAEKLFLTKNKQQVYRDLVELLVKVGRFETAIEYIEQAKQRDLASLYQKGENLQFTLKETSNYTELKKYIAKIQLIERQLLHSSEKKERLNLQQQLDKLVSGQEAFTKEVLQKNPKVTEILGLKPVSFASIQAAIPKDTIVLETFSLLDKLVLAIFDSTSLKIKILPISDSQLDRNIQLLLSTLSHKREMPIAEKFKLSQELYELLILPFENEILKAKHLTIVVNDKLQYLPFQVLRSKDKYLIESMSISYLASASSLIYYTESMSKKGSGQVLGYGNPFPQDIELKLPEAETETKALSKIFGDRALIRTGQEATKSLLLKEIRYASYIHLATHAHLEPRDPKRSFIMLAGNSEQDKKLYYNELSALELELGGVELITLSACETALGRDGIELFGISEQFRRAGVKAVVASLWKVNDKSTKELVIKFYQCLSEGENKNQALRHAQLHLINSQQSIYSDPFYWAPFILIGKFN